MRGSHRTLLWVQVVCVLAGAARAETILTGAAERRQAVARLGVLGSALMVGAHPDDENTATLAALARGRLIRTAYLSLTRGEGGQNLIGPEQGALLGVIRTQELLAARRIDGAEQYFTRAIDFGFSKTAEETLAKWGRERILADVVWVVRSFQPDVIISVFSGTPRDGHGQHQTAGILAREAFDAAADPQRFPEQFRHGVRPWRARRLVLNLYGGAANADYTIDVGAWNPVIGYSYNELAALSRSQHRSQGMGVPARRGEAAASLSHAAGQRGKGDLFDGIDTTWSRVPGGAEIGRILAEALRSLDDEHPERTVPALLDARRRIAALTDPWAKQKLREIDETIALCAGLWLDASAPDWRAVPGSTVKITAAAIERVPAPAVLRGVSLPGEPVSAEKRLAPNQPVTEQIDWTVPASAEISQPYWLRQKPDGDVYVIPRQELAGLPESPPALAATFSFEFGSERIEFTRPVVDRYVDRSRGELTRPFEIVPPVALEWTDPVLVFPNQKAKEVRVVLRADTAVSGDARLAAPPGWKVAPASQRFEARAAGDQIPLAFTVTPPAGLSHGALRAVARAGEREFTTGMVVLDYPHFPPQTIFPPAERPLVRADIEVLARRVGYIMGAGDQVPQALAQLGCEVVELNADDVARADLSAFDAIVAGVRAYNTRPELRANQRRLMDYVERGGTYVVQYTLNDFRTTPEQTANLGPFPFTIGRSRVSVEEAPVTLTHPDDPLLQRPNRITAADFAGWVQERGLYFPSDWDPHYHTLFSTHDPGEPPLEGGTLYAQVGRGVFVYTTYSWFRQLPAGVPGAYRIFANLLSAGKVLAASAPAASAARAR